MYWQPPVDRKEFVMIISDDLCFSNADLAYQAQRVRLLAPIPLKDSHNLSTPRVHPSQDRPRRCPAMATVGRDCKSRCACDESAYLRVWSFALQQWIRSVLMPLSFQSTRKHITSPPRFSNLFGEMEALFLLSRLDDTSTPPPSLFRRVSLFLRTCSRLFAVTLRQQPVALVVVGWMSMHIHPHTSGI